ncbi:MAG: monovalent cation:proton antiporter-2 (CPA2) family protein [Deltaproteobacteria bacterium]|nr:monovalent cation:proton antiporter-2 (CPA2) family protein [Deltaproteobacteria bacterium]
MTEGFLFQALVYLTAAIICVPVAKRLGMGSVLGYLLAGIAIGPFVLGFIGREGQDIMHFAEFGVVMMLFLIGLELEPSHFWQMRHRIVGMGGVQVIATTTVLCTGLILLNFSWKTALAASLALAMSSTAIALQSLKEKGLGETEAGRGSFAVLLFQDIAVIPILALLPLLAAATSRSTAVHHQTIIGGLPGWLQAAAVLGAIGTVFLAGRFIIVPLLRLAARTHLREILTAAALLIVIATAFLMQLVGLSPALGTFLAGVVLANSEFRHELESDLEPIKGLLLGLFFIAVGASINFKLLMEGSFEIIPMVFAVIAVKTVVLMGTGRLFKISFDQNLIFALGLSQIGEFAFVLFSFMHQLHILPDPLAGRMMAVTALSMTTTPLLLFINERFILPRFGTRETVAREADVIDIQHPVIIAGFGDFGSTIGRFLRANGIAATILDNDSDRVDLLRKMGFKAFYGDATRLDILKSAGAQEARILIIAITDSFTHFDLIEKVGKHYPHLDVMVRVKGRHEAYNMIEMGLTGIYRESVDASVRLGIDALVKLGYRRYAATRAGQNFIKYDEAALLKLAPHHHDEKSYIYNAREQIMLQEQLLANDRDVNPIINDHAWDSDLQTDRQVLK